MVMIRKRTLADAEIMKMIKRYRMRVEWKGDGYGWLIEGTRPFEFHGCFEGEHLSLNQAFAKVFNGIHFADFPYLSGRTYRSESAAVRHKRKLIDEAVERAAEEADTLHKRFGVRRYVGPPRYVLVSREKAEDKRWFRGQTEQFLATVSGSIVVWQ